MLIAFPLPSLNKMCTPHTQQTMNANTMSVKWAHYKCIKCKHQPVRSTPNPYCFSADCNRLTDILRWRTWITQCVVLLRFRIISKYQLFPFLCHKLIPNLISKLESFRIHSSWSKDWPRNSANNWKVKFLVFTANTQCYSNFKLAHKIHSAQLFKPFILVSLSPLPLLPLFSHSSAVPYLATYFLRVP